MFFFLWLIYFWPLDPSLHFAPRVGFSKREEDTEIEIDTSQVLEEEEAKPFSESS